MSEIEVAGTVPGIDSILAEIDVMDLEFGHQMWSTAFGRAQLRTMAVTAAVEGMPLDEILPTLIELIEGTSTQFPS